MSGFGHSEIATITIQSSNGNHKSFVRYNNSHYVFPASIKDVVAVVLRQHEPFPESPIVLLGEKAVAAFQDFVNLPAKADELFIILSMGAPFTMQATLVSALKSEMQLLAPSNEQIKEMSTHSLFVCIVEGQYKHAHVKLANQNETSVKSVLDFDTLEKTFYSRWK